MEATCGALIGATMMAGIMKPGEEKCDNGTGDIKQISGNIQVRPYVKT